MAVPPRGLSPQDLDQLRVTLGAGRKPKVVFTASAGQIAGTVGQVVELTDPAASDEWIVVRFGRDELPFSPTDLAIPSKAPAQRKTTAAAASSKTAPVRIVEKPPAPAAAAPPPAVKPASAPPPAAGPAVRPSLRSRSACPRPRPNRRPARWPSPSRLPP